MNPKRYTVGVMANSGYSDITVVKSGILFTVPQKCMNSIGNIKVHLSKLINKCSSIEDAMKLSQFGIDVTLV